MIISDKYKFLVFHNPKCGGSTMATWSRSHYDKEPPYRQNIHPQECTMESFRKQGDGIDTRDYGHGGTGAFVRLYGREKFDEYKKYILVRNPIDQCKSLLNQFVKHNERFGEKPLYIMKKKEGIYFGSEIKYLKSLSQKKFKINEGHLIRYLFQGYKSLYKYNSTFYENVENFPNASFTIINKNLRINYKKYWKLNFKSKKMNFKYAVSKVKKIILKKDVELNIKIFQNIKSIQISLEKLFETSKIHRNDFSDATLAIKLNIPVSHVRLIFKYYSNFTLSELKHYLRINDAIKIIKKNKGDILLKQVGAVVGYKTYSSFYREYNKYKDF